MAFARRSLRRARRTEGCTIISEHFPMATNNGLPTYFQALINTLPRNAPQRTPRHLGGQAVVRGTHARRTRAAETVRSLTRRREQHDPSGLPQTLRLKVNFELWPSREACSRVASSDNENRASQTCSGTGAFAHVGRTHAGACQSLVRGRSMKACMKAGSASARRL